MKVEELKNYLEIRGLKVTGTKNELVVLSICCQWKWNSTCKNSGRNGVWFKNKLKIDDIPILDPSKIPHGWMEEDEGMTSWPVLSYPDIFNFLMIHPGELGSKDLCDYKTSKAYSYYQSRWLQPLQYHNLSINKNCIIRECRKCQSVKDPFHKLWAILEKT